MVTLYQPSDFKYASIPEPTLDDDDSCGSAECDDQPPFPPTESEVTVATPSSGAMPTVQTAPSRRATTALATPNPGRFTRKRDRDIWVRSNLPSKIQVQLDQPFGKPSLRHSFYSAVRFRHALLPVYKSGFLSRRDRASLETASVLARWLSQTIRQHRDVDFSALKDPIPDDMPISDMMTSYSRMFTAAAIHFDLEIPALVAYVGGTHVGAYRPPTAATLAILRDGGVEEAVLLDLSRIFDVGCPAICQAEASEENFRAFLHYGNHRSVDEAPAKTKKAVAKDVRKSFAMTFDPRLVWFVPHLHTTPLGMVDLTKRYKSPRPVFDSTHRPHPWCFSINDWTSLCNEPILIFAGSKLKMMIWIWNLRISYPQQEIYPGDDDVSGAFRHSKYNPFLVALHSYLIYGYLVMATGQTFGDCASPSNWEPIARARQQFAMFLWTQADTLARAAQYIPRLTFTEPPADSQYAQAATDSLNQGVILPDGTRRSPTYDHHVDDNMYADVREFMPLTIAASILSLYVVLGFPSPTCRDALSWDKFEASFSHERKIIGIWWDTRRLTVSLPSYKREQLIETLALWSEKDSFFLLEAAELLGSLVDASLLCRWGPITFFAIQNAIRRALASRYHKVAGYFSRQGLMERFSEDLPPNLESRALSLVSKQMARVLWKDRSPCPAPPDFREEIKWLHSYLSVPANTWEISIGHIIPRDPTFTSAGDASLDAGGAVSDDLRFWFDILWSASIRRGVRLNSSHPDYVHINCLEYLVQLVQHAAAITMLEEGFPPEVMANLPGGDIPPLPILLSRTDSMSSNAWTSKVTSSSWRGQNLVKLQGALFQRSPLGHESKWLAGIDNVEPDYISRPDLSLPAAAWHPQMFRQMPKLRCYRFFQPSPEFTSLLSSHLSTKRWLAPPRLPKTLGRFVPGASITSFSVTI